MTLELQRGWAANEDSGVIGKWTVAAVNRVDEVAQDCGEEWEEGRWQKIQDVGAGKVA